MSTNPPNEPLNLENLRERLLRLGLHGLLASVRPSATNPGSPSCCKSRKPSARGAASGDD
jgi:hypothetical protein